MTVSAHHPSAIIFWRRLSRAMKNFDSNWSALRSIVFADRKPFLNNIPRMNSTILKLSRIVLFCNGYAMFSNPSNLCILAAVKKHQTFQADSVVVYILGIKQSNSHNAFDHAQFTNKSITVKHDLKKTSSLWPYSNSYSVKTGLRRADQLHGSSHIHTKTARAQRNSTNAKNPFMDPRATASHKEMLPTGKPSVAPRAQKKKKGSCNSYKIEKENKEKIPNFDNKRANTQYPNFTCYDGKKLKFMKEEDDGIELSDQQKNVLRAVSSGKSVFITGAAGTGKTYILKRIIEVLKKIHGKGHVFVTASTGLAASAMQGTSLHCFAGIGVGLGDVESLVCKVELDKRSKFRWRKAKVLVIDEISLISGELFDKLNCVAKRIRYPKTESREFGGLQMVVTGDFCQLPPVKESNVEIEKYFAFQADCWDNCFDLQIQLTEIFRQSEDLEFMEMLNQMRMGICSPESINMLQACQGMPIDDGITPTKLFPYKRNVIKENEQKLKEIGKELITFRAEDSGLEDKISHSTRALKELSLCVGAQVMLIYNINIRKGLVNGRKGLVVGFKADTSTSDKNNEADTSGSDENNEANTTRSTENDISSRCVWPIVKFQGLSELVTVKPQCYEVYDFDKKGNLIVAATRRQIPLILAWAFTVHKCQGMTLDRIETDLTNVFDYGMVYVALSRLKKLDGLRLVGFNPSKVKAHPDVIDFYERLSKRRIIP